MSSTPLLPSPVSPQVPLRARKARLARPLRLFCGVLLGLWAVTLVNGLFARFWLHLDEQYWNPLHPTGGMFVDFSFFLRIDPLFHRMEFFHSPGFSYPAPMAFVLRFFYRFGTIDTPLKVYLGFISLVFAASGVWFTWMLTRRGFPRAQAVKVMCVTCLLSYPAMWMFERANTEAVCWMVVAGGVAAYWRRRWVLAAVLFGIAGSLKLFPAILLALLILPKQYKALALGAATAIGTNLLALWALGPTMPMAWAGVNAGMLALRNNDILQFRPLENCFDHSLFGMVRLVFHGLHPNASPAESIVTLGSWLRVYMALGAAGGLALYGWGIRRMPRINQLLALTIAAILLPPLSYDYTILHLYLPFSALLLFVARQGHAAEHWPGLALAMVLFAVLFAPESYLFWHGLRWSGQFRGGVLLVLLFVSLRYPFPDDQPSAFAGDGS